MNITEAINSEQSSVYEFPTIVTSTVDGKLKNKNGNAIAICICKVGNMKLYAFIGLILTSLFSILAVTIYFICWANN